MTTDQKGAIAEAAIVLAAMKLGIDVYRPVAEGGRHDLIFDLGERLLRIQCKWAARRRNVMIVRCRSCRRTRDGFLHRPYTADEIDAFAAYSPDTDRCYFLPIELFPHSRAIKLRLPPTKDCQRRGINWAKEFEIRG